MHLHALRTTSLLVVLAALAAGLPPAQAATVDIPCDDGDGSCIPDTTDLLPGILTEPAKSCTTTTDDSCVFRCAPGDTIYVGAAGGLWVSVTGACGGRVASCWTPWGICNGQSRDIVRVDDVGICEGREYQGRPTITCAAAPANETSA